MARAEPMDAESIGQMLLSVVAERTGYPVEMLNVDMELDTDLGIDSIKKVEILSVLRERVGDVPGGDLAALATLRTLRAISERVGNKGQASAAPPALAALPADGTVKRPADVAPAARWAVRAVVAPPSGLAMLGLTEGTLAVTDEGAGIAPLIVAELGRRGIRAEVVRQAPPDGCGLIVLDGLRPVASVGEALDIQRGVFRMARSVAPRMRDEGGIFVTVQDTGGDFGLASYLADAGPGPAAGTGASSPSRAWLGGLTALVKTAAREWPRASVKAIDCAIAQRSPAEAAAAIAAELTCGGAAVAVGLRADGTRITTELTAAPVGLESPRIGPQSVIVATGGARGMTAAALRLLAARHRPRLVLLGRTRLDTEPAGLSAATSERDLIGLLASRQPGTPAEITAIARRILAVREIRATLSAIEHAGGAVRYYPLDVRDTAAVEEALCEVRSDWGPVTGIVHGAGVLADALLADKTDEQFADVFNTKVEGLGALLTATAHDPLELLCVFSSAAGQFGNQGQSDYAMANEVLNQVLSAEQARRPGCLVRAIGWGPWRGGMVTQDLAERFVAAGVQLIDPDIGAQAFLAELGQPAGDVRVIVSAAARADQAMSDDLPAAQVTVSEPDYGYLADHQIAGVPVVPVSTVIDWFAGAARAWRPTAASVVLRELRVLEKISLPRLADGGHRLVLRVRRAGRENGQIVDLDLRDAADVSHYRASAATGSPPVPGTWAAPAGLAPLKWSYDGTTLFHGPRFQAIRAEPSVCPAGAQCTVVGARALGWDEAAWHVDPAAVDGGLQLAVLWAQEAGTGRTLPMAIRECRVHRYGAVEEEVRCVVLAKRAGESTATCDIALIDPDGAPRVELLGVELVRRPS
jgi:NADP-dependent 3-hydroxy acid dehydrogenase YdfG